MRLGREKWKNGLLRENISVLIKREAGTVISGMVVVSAMLIQCMLDSMLNEVVKDQVVLRGRATHAWAMDIESNMLCNGMINWVSVVLTVDHMLGMCIMAAVLTEDIVFEERDLVL